MASFMSIRPPEINASDLPTITRLLATFDKITFNSYGDLVALINTPLPFVGNVVISLYVVENHVKVYKAGDADADLWNGYLHELIPDHPRDEPIDRHTLTNRVNRKIRDAFNQALDEEATT